jgi:NAD(P)-dependent dehydrogenase (short-subunit alcohol dehydrogenase family)
MATRRSAFISGAGRNIGRATALELARRGCNVIINGARNRAICDAVAAECSTHGVEAVVLMGDVGKAAEARGLAEAALARFGTIDILVNNAAIRPHQGFLEITEADWHRVIDIDLNAAMHFARAFLPGMIARGWGRIVNVTGMNAIMGNPAGAHISAAKHGVWGGDQGAGARVRAQGGHGQRDLARADRRRRRGFAQPAPRRRDRPDPARADGKERGDRRNVRPLMRRGGRLYLGPDDCRQRRRGHINAMNAHLCVYQARRDLPEYAC